MELMDTTLVNLKVISKLEPSVKLETDAYYFNKLSGLFFQNGHEDVVWAIKIYYT